VEAVLLGHRQVPQNAVVVVDAALLLVGLQRDDLGHPDSPDTRLAKLIVLRKRQFGDVIGMMRRLVWVGESGHDDACPCPTAERQISLL
jgi:hypothetical protein